EMIATRLDAILEQVTIVETNMPEIAKWQREKLNQKLDDLKTDIDESRLEQELIYLAQKQDVAEELDRLKSHVKETRKI
ncbi:endoribonuclease YicC domain-containing protein, partial [Streptococcus suis]